MKTEIKWGLVLGVLMLLWNLLMAVSGFHGDFIEYHPKVDTLFFIPFMLIFYLALKQVRDLDQGGIISFMDCIKSSLIISLVALPIFLLATYITVQYISPNYFTNAINAGIRMGQDEEMLRNMFNVKSYMILTFTYVVFGVIAGAIVALFIQRKSS